MDSQTTTTERRLTAVTLYKRGRKYSIQLWVDGIRSLKSTGTTNRREADDRGAEQKENGERGNRAARQGHQCQPDRADP